jgi:hypothetical protein
LKTTWNHLWRVLVAALLLAAISVGAELFLASPSEPPGADPYDLVCLPLVLLSSLFVATALAHPIFRSRWAGAQLACVVLVVQFGIYTFIHQNPALLTVPAAQVSQDTLSLLMARGFLIAVLFAFAIVLLLGRMKQREFIMESARLHLPVTEWLWKLGLAAGLGVLLYVAGRLVVWPRLPIKAAGVEAPPLAHAIAVQIGRTFMLVAFVLPVIKMMRGTRLEATVTVGILFAVLGGAALLGLRECLGSATLPWIPALYVAAGNLVLGCTVGFLFSRRASAA